MEENVVLNYEKNTKNMICYKIIGDGFNGSVYFDKTKYTEELKGKQKLEFKIKI